MPLSSSLLLSLVLVLLSLQSTVQDNCEGHFQYSDADYPNGIQVLQDGSFLVAGSSFASASAAEDIFVTRFRGDGAKTWHYEDGSSGTDAIRALALSQDEATACFAGFTDGALFSSSHQSINPFMAIVACMAVADGSVAWKTQFGSSVYDIATAASIDGDTLIVGGVTGGNLFGTNQGEFDIWIASYNIHTQNRNWGIQHGTSETDLLMGISHSVSMGAVFAVGETFGELFPEFSISFSRRMLEEEAKEEEEEKAKAKEEKEAPPRSTQRIVNTRSEAFMFVFDLDSASQGSGVQWGVSSSYSSAKSVVAVQDANASVTVSWVGDLPSTADAHVLLSRFSVDVASLLRHSDFSVGKGKPSSWTDDWTSLVGFQPTSMQSTSAIPLAPASGLGVYLGAYMTLSTSSNLEPLIMSIDEKSNNLWTVHAASSSSSSSYHMQFPSAIDSNPSDNSLLVAGQTAQGGVAWRRMSVSGTTPGSLCSVTYLDDDTVSDDDDDGQNNGNDDKNKKPTDDGDDDGDDDVAVAVDPATEGNVALVIFGVAIFIVGVSGCVFFYFQRARALQRRHSKRNDEFSFQRSRQDMAEAARLNKHQPYQLASRDFDYEF